MSDNEYRFTFLQLGTRQYNYFWSNVNFEEITTDFIGDNVSTNIKSITESLDNVHFPSITVCPINQVPLAGFKMVLKICSIAAHL